MNKKRLWAVLLGVALGRIAFSYQVQTVAALTPYFVEQGIGYATLGSLIGAYMLPGVFTALPLGLLGRWFGEHRLLYVGLALMAVGNCVPLLAPDVAILAAGRVIAGVGAVAMSVVFGKVLAELFHGDLFVLTSGVAVAAFPLGVGLSQMASPVLLDTLGWRAAFLAGAALAGLGLISAIAGFWGRPPPRAVTRFGWPSRRECLLTMICGAVWTVYNAGYYGFMSYVPALLLSRGISSAQTGWIITLATWISVPAILGGGAIVARVGSLKLFLLGAVTLSASIVGIALSSHWLLWCLLFGTLGALHPGIIMAAGTLSARPENRAIGMGVFYTTYYAGAALFPALCGHFADSYGTPAAALLAASAISVLTIPVFLLHQWLAHPKPSPCMPSPAT